MDEYFDERKEDDMEMSDNEDEPTAAKKKKKFVSAVDEMVANANQGEFFSMSSSLRSSKYSSIWDCLVSCKQQNTRIFYQHLIGTNLFFFVLVFFIIIFGLVFS
jgi:hypothetical protein